MSSSGVSHVSRVACHTLANISKAVLKADVKFAISIVSKSVMPWRSSRTFSEFAFSVSIASFFFNCQVRLFSCVPALACL